MGVNTLHFVSFCLRNALLLAQGSCARCCIKPFEDLGSGVRGEIKGKKLLIMCGTQHEIKMGLFKLIVGGHIIGKQFYT